MLVGLKNEELRECALRIENCEGAWVTDRGGSEVALLATKASIEIKLDTAVT